MKIRVVSWNIFGGKNAGPIVEVLKKINADIILLQEVTTAEDIAQGLQYNHFLCKGQTIGNAIMSHYPIISSACHPLTTEITYDGTPSTELRVAATATISIENTILNIISSHLYYPHNQASPHGSAIDQQKKLATLIKKQNVIVGGDFNTEGSNQELSVLKTWLTDCNGQDNRPTFHNIKYDTNEKKRLDHMLVSPEFEVVSYDVIETTISDHYPIIADLILQ